MEPDGGFARRRDMRIHLVLSALVFAVVGAACSVSGAATRADPEPGDPWLGANCRDIGVAAPTQLGRDQPIVLSIGSSGPWFQPLLSQSLTIYADGTAVRTEYSQAPSLTTLTAGYLPFCAFEQAKRDMQDMLGNDFGSPQITDQAIVWMVLTEPGEQDQRLSVYAPGQEDELNRAQRNNRERFRALEDGLDKAFVELNDYQPDRIAIRAQDGSDNGAVETAGEPWVTWSARPLSQIMDGQTCAVLSGDDAKLVGQDLAGKVSIQDLDPSPNLEIEIAVLPPGIQAC